MKQQTVLVDQTTNYHFKAGEDLAPAPVHGGRHASLTAQESATLFDCERVIEKGQETFLEVGAALVRIRKERLYRHGYGTFEEYCRKRWGWSARRAGQIAASSEVVENLIETAGPQKPEGDKDVFTGGNRDNREGDREEKEDDFFDKPRVVQADPAVAGLPKSERVARPLARLPKEEQRPAWEAAVKAAPEGKVRGEDVEREVKKRLDAKKGTSQEGNFSQEQTEVTERKQSDNAKAVVILLRDIMEKVGGVQALMEVEKDDAGLHQLKNLTGVFSALLWNYSKRGPGEKTQKAKLTPKDQSLADKKTAKQALYVICREPRHTDLVRKPRYGPGWGHDPRKAESYTKVEALKRMRDWEVLVPLQKAVRRFEKGL